MPNNKSAEVDTIRAWWRLEQAFAAFNADLRRRHDVTGSQLALLRIIAERQPVTIRTLRQELHWHPASLGQAVQRLVARSLVLREPSNDDRRMKVLQLTDAGQSLLQEVPLVGPVRVRQLDTPAEDLVTMRRGFETALEAFALTRWSPDE